MWTAVAAAWDRGTSQNSWNPGMDGVRITVVDAESGQPVSTPFDLTNKNPTIKIHFGKISKIQYSRGTGISPHHRKLRLLYACTGYALHYQQRQYQGKY